MNEECEHDTLCAERRPAKVVVSLYVAPYELKFTRDEDLVLVDAGGVSRYRLLIIANLA